VTTISEASKEELRKWVGPLADKVVVVPDCVFEEFAYDPKPFNEECPVVLQVGTKWNKNVERVMEAVATTGCQLEVVGELQKTGHGLTRIDTDESDRQMPPGLEENAHTKVTLDARGASPNQDDLIPTDLKLKTTAAAEPAVNELGRLTDGELVAAYQRCDMVVFVSLYEGFGLPILEAQAMGRPVITSNFGAMREAAGDGALLVDPYSVEEIRAAIMRIRNEPGLREELVRKGRENAERFRADAIALKYAQIYRALATD
jgi:glycosyltransferase involved in cell wall biosynthesis